MRIVQVCYAFPPHVGGIDNFVRSLSLRLQRHGHEVTVLTTSAGAAGHVDAGGLRVIRQRCWNGLERHKIPWPVVFPTAAPAAIRALREADIVHAHGVLFQTSAFACAYCRLTGKPLVVTEHAGIVPYRSTPLLVAEMLAFWSIGRAVARLADAVVVLNAPVRDQIAHLRGFRGDISIVPYGVDTEIFRPATCAAEKNAIRARLGWDARPRVVSVGRLTEKKGMDILLAAIDPAFEIVLCGPGEPPPLPAGAVHLGARTHEEIAELLRAADVFCLMSVGEGFPLALQEAMATSLPVVITDDPRYWGYLRRSEVAMAPQDPVKVRAAILRYLRDPAAAQRAGDLGVHTVRRLFSWETVLEAHEQLYARVRQKVRGRSGFGVARYDLASLERIVEVGHLAATEPGDGPALDVGAGSGFVQSEVLRGTPRIVIDADEQNLQLCRRSVARADAPPVVALVARAEALPFRTAVFQTVLCTDVLEHCEDDRLVVAELARVLAENGSLILSVPALRFGFDSYLHLIGAKTVHDADGPERHYRAGYPLHTLKPLLEEFGLFIEEVREYTGPLTRLALDMVSLGNLAYHRVAGGGRGFTWSDIAASETSTAFQIYRAAVFPVLRTLMAIDRNLPFPRGFQLAVRARRISVREVSAQFEWMWDRSAGMSMRRRYL